MSLKTGVRISPQITLSASYSDCLLGCQLVCSNIVLCARPLVCAGFRAGKSNLPKSRVCSPLKSWSFGAPSFSAAFGNGMNDLMQPAYFYRIAIAGHN